MGDEDLDAPHLNLKQFWHKVFDETFEDFSPDEWSLTPTETNITRRGWQKFQDKAKVFQNLLE
jgi:hypothetical protein